MKKKISVPKPTILTGKEVIDEASRVLRAGIEKKRGIVRDDKGRIIRSKEWLEERIKYLKEKSKIVKDRIKIIKDKNKKKDLENRLVLIEEEIKQRSVELKNK